MLNPLTISASRITLLIPQIIRAMVDEGIRGGQIGVIQRGSLGLLALAPFWAYGAVDSGRRCRPLFRAIRQQMDELTTLPTLGGTRCWTTSPLRPGRAR